jgi:hypothetical protein
MTINDIRLAVQKIRECADDDEMAHSKEDDLYIAVLKAIADGKAGPRHAAEALKAQAIDFARYCS